MGQQSFQFSERTRWYFYCTNTQFKKIVFLLHEHPVQKTLNKCDILHGIDGIAVSTIRHKRKREANNWEGKNYWEKKLKGTIGRKK